MLSRVRSCRFISVDFVLDRWLSGRDVEQGPRQCGAEEMLAVRNLSRSACLADDKKESGFLASNENKPARSS
jgi:hypothetical protein